MVKREQAKVDVGEAVGIVAAQSIGEPGTQMSLAYDEKVVVKDESGIRVERIGEFVDSMFDRFGFVSENGHEICELPIEIYTPSLCEDEKIEWRRVSALSRHRSPEKMLTIRTRSGRVITATPFHSFVIRKDNRIVPIAGSALKRGDRLPVVRNLRLPTKEIAESIDAKLLTDPYIKHMVSAELYAHPRQTSRPLPQRVDLDENATPSHVSLSATEPQIQEGVQDLAGSYSLIPNEYDNAHGFSLEHDNHVNSTTPAQMLAAACGTGPHEKCVPRFAYSADEQFIGALLRGYFDGDGNVDLERKTIHAHSASKALIDGIALLLARLGIFASKRKEGAGYSLHISQRYAGLFLEKIGSDMEERRNALAAIAAGKARADNDSTDVIPGIGDALARAARSLGVPSRVVNSFTKRDRIGRSTLLRYLALFETLAKEKGIAIAELTLLRRAAESDVVWDEIISVEETRPATRWVYDFTVPGSETFTTFDGLITHNTMRTFHYAGVAEQVPTGLPRLIEIVDVRREPKRPLMNIYLKPEYAKDEEKARSVAEELEEVSLSKIAEIRENFAKKEIEVVIDMELMRYEGLELDGVLKKVKAAAPGKVEAEDNRLLIIPKNMSLKAMRRLTGKLRELHLKGVRNIGRAIVLRENDEYYIRTGGSNLEEVLKLPEVDARRVYTNNIKEIERILGIEAARNAIVLEAKQVLDMQRLDVDVRHLMLLADAMCMDGEVKPVGRHGLSGEKASILARAAFEETIKHLINASVKGEEDRLVGVTENIIIGQPIPIGTGIVNLAMRRKK